MICSANFRKFCSSLMFLLVLLLPACGGGSVGTGVSVDRRSFEGKTVAPDDSPISGARVTLLETGESTATASDGRFYLPSNFDGPVANLEVETGNLKKSVSINNSRQQTSGVQLTLVVNPAAQTVSYSDLEVSVQVRGACDYYFENTRTIRQANELEDGTLCSLRVEIRSGGKPLENAPFRFERRRCLDGAPWHLESNGVTASASDTTPLPDDKSNTSANTSTVAPSHPGVTRLPWIFFNDEAHCVYRVVAPDIQGVEPGIYEIHTFRKQEYDRTSRR